METQELETLFEKHQNGVFNFACSILKNPEDAKDVTQEAFIRAFASLPKLKDASRFSSYLFTTTRNLAFDEIKKRSRFSSPEMLEYEEEKHIAADPQRSLLLKEQRDKVRAAAENLNDEYRGTLYLKELEGMTYQEISQVMGIPKNSVGVLLLRARLKFKQEYRMSHVDIDQLTKECQKMLPLLSAYVDGELSDEQMEKVDQHLEDCELCRSALEEMTESSKSYRAMLPLIPPATLKKDVFGKAKDFSPARSLHLTRILAAAGLIALVVTVSVGVALYSSDFAARPQPLKKGYEPAFLDVIKTLNLKSQKPATSSVSGDSSPGTTGEAQGQGTQGTQGTTGTTANTNANPPQVSGPPASSQPAVCPTCGGTGRITCWYCSGNRYIVCSRCGGTGQIWDPIESVWVTCPTCGGSRVFVCPVCLGVGTLDCPDCD